MNEKFQGAASPQLLPEPGSLPPDPWVAYAYLFKSLPFEWAFEREKGWGLTFAGQKVETFGIGQLLRSDPSEVKAASQVSVYDYKGDDDFVIELRTRSASDRLILAKVARQSTLAQTIRAVQERLHENEPAPMTQYSNLFIPVLNFDVFRRYKELLPAWAAQQIRFKLDETGAVIKSEALHVRTLSQELIFDKPFLVMLQRVDAKNPYFALWVANAELLVPFGVR